MSIFYKILLCICLSFATLHAQNIENFNNFIEGTSYNSGSFSGNSNVKWNYYEAKGGQSVENTDEPAVCLNKSASAKLISDSIPGGCSTLTLRYEQEYTSNCDASVFINSVCVANLVTTSQVDIPQELNISNLDFCGMFVISIVQNSSSSGHLSIDDISWTNLDCSSQPPRVFNHSNFNDLIKINFTKNIDLNIITPYSFSADFSILSWKFSGKDELILSIVPPDCGSANLLLKDIYDSNGIRLKDTILLFEFEKQIKYGDIIVSEIMIDPNPVVYLPDAEYFEIYNRTDCPVNIKNWIVKVNDSYQYFPDIEILPDSFLFFSNDSLYKDFNNFYYFEDMPTLLNSGARISIFDKSKNLVSYLDYSPNMYENIVKKEGGWSLERQDLRNFGTDVSNWNSSISITGGTPGYKNSVNISLPDTLPPKIISVYPINSSVLEIRLNEYTQSLGNILISDTITVDSVVPLNVERTIFQIFLNDSIEDKKIYKVNFSEVLDAFGNKVESENQIAFPHPVLEKDILINEILFNPRPDSFDFVELYNNSQNVVDLSTLYIANCDINTGIIKDFYRVVDYPILLFPNEYCVLSEFITNICNEYSCSEISHFIELPQMPSFNDDEGCMIVLDKLTQKIDSVYYTENWHHELIYDNEGVSLERISFSVISNDRNNWHSAAESVGFASPGFKNSQAEDTLLSNKLISLAYSVFTPDNDGDKDYITIEYSLPSEGFFVSVLIFNEAGELIRKLYNNYSVSLSGSLFWDGNDSENSVVKNGIYIMKVSFFNSNGDTVSKKFACAKL